MVESMVSANTMELINVVSDGRCLKGAADLLC